MSVKAVTIVSIVPSSPAFFSSSSVSMPRVPPGPPGLGAASLLFSPDATHGPYIVGYMASKEAIRVIEPATEEVMAEIPRAGVEETDAAIERASEAFPAWRAMDPAARSALLHDLADAIAERQEDLAKLEARNAGKPISDARGEMGMVVETFRYYAGAPERLTGKTIPVSGGIDMTFREPLGVVGLITPWNFPLTIASWKVAPALAAGNTIVLKPAELTPLTAVELEKIARGGGRAGGRAQRRRRARAASAGSASSSTPTSPRSPSPARPRSAAESRRAPRPPSSGSPSSWAASRPT